MKRIILIFILLFSSVFSEENIKKFEERVLDDGHVLF